MSTVKVSAQGQFPPDRFVEALTDFGSHRTEVWGSSSASLFTVHELGDTWADVTEGTVAGGIWQRYRYDWSVPGVVRLDVLDSNAFGKGSFWEYRLASDTEGGTRIDLTIHRVPTTAKGKLFDPFLRLVGKAYFGRDLRRTIRQLERRNVR
jgi:hypothetical protein